MLFIVKLDFGGSKMTRNKEGNDKILSKQQIIIAKESEIISLNEKIFQNFLSLLEPYKSKLFHENPETKSLMYLGGLLCDTIYKQQKYFRTAGMIKQIAPFATFITENKVKHIYQKCHTLQKAISKKEMRKLPPILKEVERFLSDIKISPQHDQLILNLALVTGYNLYGKAVKSSLKNNSTNLATLKKDLSMPEEIMLKNYASDFSFQYGYFLARYFFTVEEIQRKKMKTSSLLKKLHAFQNQGTLIATTFLIREINLVSLKLLGFNWQFGSKEIQSELPGSEFQIALFKLMFEEFKNVDSINKDSLLLGFGTGFSLSYFDITNLKNPFKIKDDTAPKFDKNGNRLIIEDYFIEEFDKKFQNNDSIIEQIGFLQGILLKSLSGEENQKLKTNRLIKQFNFQFRHFTPKNIIRIENEIYHVLISLWIHDFTQNPKLVRSNVTLKYWKIRLKLITLIGIMNFNEERENPAAVISLMQGFESFNKLYKIYNPNN